MNIKFPLKHDELPISAAHASEWKAVLVERMSTLPSSMLEKLQIDSVSLVFWSAQSLAWALMYLPPAALTASERASWAVALVPENKDRLLSALESLHEDADRLSEKLQSLSVDAAALASHVKTKKQETHGRVTDYVSPEALAMYRAITTACTASRFPHRRHMCKEWHDDYKAFERYFLEHNVCDVDGTGRRFVADKEGIIAGVLDDPDSPLHGQVVYGPGTVMFVSKFVQSFYNRTKRDFSAKLEELRAKDNINEAEYLFMKKKGA